MRRIMAVSALVGALVVAGAGAPAGASTTRLVAYMYGSNEVPGPGGSGVGRAVVTVNPSAGQVCVALQVTGVNLPLSGFHVHHGAAGVAGPVVVPFSPPAVNQSYQCTTATSSLLNSIVASPGDYYVNVHNASHPAGAARGQLQTT